MIGPGKAFDTNKYFVICSNVLGGCRGTTGPGSLNPATGCPYAMSFPVITIGDMVRLQKMLIDSFGIRRLLSLSGGSMGGMQALEWAAAYPDSVVSAIPIAATTRHSAQQIAFNEVGRQAIMADHVSALHLLLPIASNSKNFISFPSHHLPKFRFQTPPPPHAIAQSGGTLCHAPSKPYPINNSPPTAPTPPIPPDPVPPKASPAPPSTTANMDSPPPPSPSSASKTSTKSPSSAKTPSPSTSPSTPKSSSPSSASPSPNKSSSASNASTKASAPPSSMRPSPAMANPSWKSATHSSTGITKSPWPRTATTSSPK